MSAKMKFVVYRCSTEVLVTTPSEEKKFLKEWFADTGRELANYDRVTYSDTGVQVEAPLRVG